MIIPPHFPLSVSVRLVPEVCPIVMLSRIEVKIMGAAAVPFAAILDPLATIKAAQLNFVVQKSNGWCKFNG